LEQAANELHMRYPQTIRLAPPPLPQDEPMETDPSEPAALVVSAPNLDTVIALGGRILLGRSDVADVSIDSAFVSRYHALILRDGTQDLLIDLGSTNGVLVNSKRVVRHVLKHRDLVQIGPARVTYLNAAVAPQMPMDSSETVAFARKGLFSDDAHTTVFAFGRFDEAG
jgi:pSer/pThr/pTyr-binding forkhead associated (FHA) protein